MARSVYDVNFYAFIDNGYILCENGDAAFPFKVIVVEYELPEIFGLANQIRLIYHPVHECRLAVVNVCDDSNVSNLLHIISVKTYKNNEFSANSSIK